MTFIINTLIIKINQNIKSKEANNKIQLCIGKQWLNICAILVKFFRGRTWEPILNWYLTDLTDDISF